MSKICYSLTFPNRLTHFVHIKMKVEVSDENLCELILPDWRPGRYELTNYVANLRDLSIADESGSPLLFYKTARNKWKVDTKQAKKLVATYRYYAYYMDAGSSVVDEEQIYINFINCLLYSPAKTDLPARVTVDIPKDYTYVCQLAEAEKRTFAAKNYYELVDSPLLAAPYLHHLTYRVSDTDFHIYIHGDCPLDDEQILADFQKFTETQMHQMGGFPSSRYDFIVQSLPYRHYHGVEHLNSTVLVLGPSSSENQKQYYLDMLGVASHELFHAWNVTRIRPKELSPYDFSRENYYETGFVTEGFTTYYGDLFLARSGVFSTDQYLDELNILLKRHFENYGRHHLSLTRSSYDLWIDGYKKLLPGRKVSIYVKGALTAWMLDLTIRQHSNNQYSLDNIIADMWEHYGKPEIGYTKENVYELIRKYIGDTAFIPHYYEGTTPIENELNALLAHIGCRLVAVAHPEATAALFGFRLDHQNDTAVVNEIAPASPAENTLSIGDKVITINQKAPAKNTDKLPDTCTVEFERNFQKKTITLQSTGQAYFGLYRIEIDPLASSQAKKNLNLWLNR